jgi:hypothetical protein
MLKFAIYAGSHLGEKEQNCKIFNVFSSKQSKKLRVKGKTFSRKIWEKLGDEKVTLFGRRIQPTPTANQVQNRFILRPPTM